MPMSYRIDEEQGVVFTTADGKVTEQHLMAHKAALLQDPKFRPGMKELSDMRAVEALEVSPEGIASAVRFDADHASDLSEHKLGLLVPTDFVFMVARMYEAGTEGNTGGVEVFRSEEEARRWLESS